MRRQCLTSGTQPPDQWLRHRMAADISGIVREKRPREMYCHVKLSQKSERENDHATSPVFQRGRSTQNLSGTRRKLPTNPLSDSLPPFGKSQEALDRMCIAYVVRSFQPGLYHCPTHPIPHSLTPEGVSSGFRRVPEPKGSEHKVCLFFSRLDSSARGRGSRQGALSSMTGEGGGEGLFAWARACPALALASRASVGRQQQRRPRRPGCANIWRQAPGAFFSCKAPRPGWTRARGGSGKFAAATPPRALDLRCCSVLHR